MGHKVNPQCLRLGISRDWASRWFTPTKKLFVQYLQQDRMIRELLERELASAAVARIVIERSAERIRVAIHTARPGIQRVLEKLLDHGGRTLDHLSGRDQVLGIFIQQGYSVIHRLFPQRLYVKLTKYT